MSEGSNYPFNLHISSVVPRVLLMTLMSRVYQNVAAVLDYCMDACAKQRDWVNITLPSVGAVQMLSQK